MNHDLHDFGYSGGAKQVDLHFLYIQDVVYRREIDFLYCTYTETNAGIIKKDFIPKNTMIPKLDCHFHHCSEQGKCDK